jgi:hypothetical protein
MNMVDGRAVQRRRTPAPVRPTVIDAQRSVGMEEVKMPSETVPLFLVRSNPAVFFALTEDDATSAIIRRQAASG